MVKLTYRAAVGLSRTLTLTLQIDDLRINSRTLQRRTELNNTFVFEDAQEGIVAGAVESQAFFGNFVCGRIRCQRGGGTVFDCRSEKMVRRESSDGGHTWRNKDQLWMKKHCDRH